MRAVPATVCTGHRAALLDFIDRREIGPGTREALDHLDRCSPCEWELEATALAIAALRRLFAEADRVEPPPDAWLRLRTRLEHRRTTPWRWRTTLGGVAMSAGLVAVLVGPLTLQPSSGPVEVGLRPLFAPARLAEERAESERFMQQRLNRTPAERVASAPAVSVDPARWPGPDGLGVPTFVPAAPVATRAD